MLMRRFSGRSLFAAALLTMSLLPLGAGCTDKGAVAQVTPEKGEKQAAEPKPAESEAAQSEPAKEEKPAGENAAEKKDDSAGQATEKPAEENGKAKEKPATEKPVEGDAPPAEDKPPFASEIPAPEFPKEMEWLNVGGPMRLKDLRGKFVLLDFWTYCCINCMHILPELKKLERQFPNELVVIGVHSAKFDTEKDSRNIKEAILRYEIEHPVVNDKEHEIWGNFGVRSWPTIVLIDPEGRYVGQEGGEFKAEQIAPIISMALPYYRKKGTLDETPLRFDLLAHQQQATPLRFPGKILADEAGGRLFISDSNHNRLVVADLSGKLIEVIGSGAIGANDGDYQQSTFDHPQGVALRGETLYVADTENHLLRKVDLKEKRVTTIAGIGSQARYAWPGIEDLGPHDQPPERWVGPPKKTGLNSPWALWIHEQDLYIAMAGPHQIWKMPLDESEIGPYAGNGAESIVDGPLLPKQPYAPGYASFAQPSGLSSDGKWLFVADSEGSSIRAVPFLAKAPALTVVGTAHIDQRARLFTFGDRDGKAGEKVLLQHALEVVYRDGVLYVADTYNNKIKKVVPKLPSPEDTADDPNEYIASGELYESVETIAGTGKPGHDDEAPTFDEPAGLAYAAGKLYVADTNNHLIRMIDLADNRVSTLTIEGLAPPEPVESQSEPVFDLGEQIQAEPAKVRAENGAVRLQVRLELPEGWKINPLAPLAYRVDASNESGAVKREAIGKLQRVEKPEAAFEISVPVEGAGSDTLTVSVNYYYCQEGGEGLCKVGTVSWRVPLEVAEDAKETTATLSHKVEP